jgi:hypothetical protein
VHCQPNTGRNASTGQSPCHISAGTGHNVSEPSTLSNSSAGTRLREEAFARAAAWNARDSRKRASPFLRNCTSQETNAHTHTLSLPLRTKTVPRPPRPCLRSAADRIPGKFFLEKMSVLQDSRV